MLLTVLMLSACHTVQTVSDTTANHLTNHIQRDSIYLHDSTAVVYKFGLSNNVLAHDPTAEGGLTDACIDPTSAPCRVDTLLVHEWHTKWREKEIVHTDTIQVETTRTETVQVRYIPSFYKYCTAFAFLVLLVLLLRLAWWVYKHFH